MPETAAFRGWKAQDAIEWFHGIGRLGTWRGRYLVANPCRSTGTFGRVGKTYVIVNGYWRARIAVETLITERPPHRTVRAQFRHTAPTSGG
jgi:hypothetical protein